jgi:hypothetical protein
MQPKAHSHTQQSTNKQQELPLLQELPQTKPLLLVLLQLALRSPSRWCSSRWCR